MFFFLNSKRDNRLDINKQIKAVNFELVRLVIIKVRTNKVILIIIRPCDPNY